MRRFDPEKELRNIQHGNRNKIIAFLFLLLVIIGVSSSYALYQVRYSKRIIYTKVAPFSNKDLNLAVYVDGVQQNEFPKKDNNLTFINLVCESGVTISDWDNDAWGLKMLTPIILPNKCNAYFTTEENVIKEFSYSGHEEEYIVEKSGKYRIELWGAQGGTSTNGGKGAYTSGIIELNKDTKLYINVGGNGFSHNGYNGGGTSRNNSLFGGGATDVRIESNNLYSRIMVAAGGSASSFYINAVNNGASGGGLVGNLGLYSNYNCSSRHNPMTNPAGGGTQTSPGTAMTCSGGCAYGTANSGSFGIGAAGETTSEYYNGGAGGGWYGGGGAAATDCNIASSGSGSSYISGHIGCVGTKSESDHTYDEICTTNPTYECSTSYTGFAFVNTIMIDGEGYYWTNKKETHIGMLNLNGDERIDGNSGDGYAKITYLGPA